MRHVTPWAVTFELRKQSPVGFVAWHAHDTSMSMTATSQVLHADIVKQLRRCDLHSAVVEGRAQTASVRRI